MSWLEIVVPLLCALLGSPLVIHLIQRIQGSGRIPAVAGLVGPAC